MNANLFIATTGEGIARAIRDGGGSWSIEIGLEGKDVRCLAADPLKPDTVYAGTQGDGVLRSDDRGRTWKPAGLKGHIVKTVAVSPHEPDTLYAGTKPALMFVSRTGGKQWTELTGFRNIRSRRFWFSPAEPPFTAYVQGIAISPADPDILLAGIEFGAVVRSTDGGETWSSHRRRALRDCHTIIFHATDGDWAYEAGGSGGGAAVSRNAGDTWAPARGGLDRNYGWACAAHPEHPEVWYVSVSPGPRKAHGENNAEACIFRKVEDSDWEKLNGGLQQPLDHMPYALLTDPEAPDHVYAGLSNGDVWHSGDRGDSWLKLPFNLGAVHRSLIML